MAGEVYFLLRIFGASLISGCALADDWRGYRISNRIIIAGFIVSMVLLLENVVHGRDWIGCVLGGMIAFALMLIIYLLGGVGAGDVKLMAVLGLLLGVKGAMFLVLGSLCVGAVLGTLGVIWKMCRNTSVAILGGRTIEGHGFHYTTAIVWTLGIFILYWLGGGSIA